MILQRVVVRFVVATMNRFICACINCSWGYLEFHSMIIWFKIESQASLRRSRKICCMNDDAKTNITNESILKRHGFGILPVISGMKNIVKQSPICSCFFGQCYYVSTISQKMNKRFWMPLLKMICFSSEFLIKMHCQDEKFSLNLIEYMHWLIEWSTCFCLRASMTTASR